MLPTIAPTLASGTTATNPSFLTIVPDGRRKRVKQPARQCLRILHLINGEHFSGAERVQQILGQRLAEFSVQAEFAMLKPGKFREFSDLPPNQVHDFPMDSRWDRKIIGSLAEFAYKKKSDLLHAHTPRTAMMAAKVAAKPKMPWIYHVHSPTVRDSNRRVLNWINGAVERMSLKTCSALITVSQSLRDEMLRRGVPASKIFVVPNGVEPQIPISIGERMRNSTWRLGVVALFRPRKGLEILLDAFEELCRISNNPERFELEVIGSFETPQYERAILAQIEKLDCRNQIHLRGFVSDVPQRMRQLDWLVLPSTFGEGMPMVVLEAMACGVPVVATSVEGTPEVIRDGIDGWLAKPGCIDSLASALLHATEDRGLWSQCSIAAAKRQAEKFSDTAMTAATADVYAEILA